MPVVVLVAGAGFGKSTVLAQAWRADAAAPPGIQAWVSCQPSHEHSGALNAAINAAVAAPDLSVAATDVLRRLAPLDVCVVLDDVHHIGVGSAGARLLAELVDDLPANVHLVLAARNPPTVPLARLRATGHLLELTEDDLAFDPGEVDRLAATFGRPASIGRSFGGWPALERVALATRPGVAIAYAREEVLADLRPAQRRALLALATVGASDDAFIGRILGSPARLDHLAAEVPMVRQIDERRYDAHELWLDALARVMEPDEVHTIRSRAVEELVAAGDVDRAGDVAIASGDWAALASAAMELVRSTISVLPLERARRWLDAAAAGGAPPSTAMDLLGVAYRAAVDVADDAVDGQLDAIVDDLRARGDGAGEVTALAIGTVVAQARGDTCRLVALALRTASVPDAADDPIVQLATCSIAAVVAEMQGDPEGAVDAFGARPDDRVPAPIAVSAERFLMHCLLLCGRAEEAVAIADRSLAAAGTEHCRSMPEFARWQAGEPVALALDRVGRDPDASARDVFLAGAFHAVMAASHGVVAPFDERRGRLDSPRDLAVVANARAAHAIVRGDDAVAAAAIGEVLAHCPGDRLVERHLRRFLALGFVLDRSLRATWERCELGPSHARARDVARLLVRLRGGASVAVDRIDPRVVLTVLPLPWSVELACRLQQQGSAAGSQLFGWLHGHVGDRAHVELRRRVGGTDGPVASGAAALLAQIPREPVEVLGVDVLGPLLVRRGDVAVSGGELRRQRVRELLAMLVVDGTISRDRAVDALWPELGAEAGARNLRVTLTYLRRVLEPDRAAGDASFHLRCDASSIRLEASSKLRVDLWEQRRLTAAATTAREAGDVAAAISAFESATALWRGAPLVDLDRIAGFETDVEQIRLGQTAALLDLGTLRLTVGNAVGALSAAERVLALEPYLEPAHRLAVAAAVQLGDRAKVAQAVGRTVAALAELGGAPEPATDMVLRTAHRDHLGAQMAS